MVRSCSLIRVTIPCRTAGHSLFPSECDVLIQADIAVKFRCTDGNTVLLLMAVKIREFPAIEAFYRLLPRKLLSKRCCFPSSLDKFVLLNARHSKKLSQPSDGRDGLSFASRNAREYSGEVDRPFRRNVTGDSAESALQLGLRTDGPIHTWTTAVSRSSPWRRAWWPPAPASIPLRRESDPRCCHASR